jgi:phage shock protein C
MERRLYRSTTEKVIGGVCGGLAEYFGIDPAIVRIIAVLAVFAHGLGLLAYLICWVAIRKRPEGVAPVKVASPSRTWTRYIPGGILILVGLVMLIDINWYWLDLDDLLEQYWPIFLIGLGLLLVLYRGNSKQSGVDETAQSGHLAGQNGGTIS